jgi:hypothetical protein
VNDAPPRKTYWVQIAIAIAAGVVLTAGSCFGFLVTVSHQNVLGRVFVVGFFGGVITVVLASVWLLVEVIKAMLRK